MRGAGTTSVSTPSPDPPRSSQAHQVSFFETAPFCFKGKSFWHQGHVHRQTPGTSLSVDLGLAFPLLSLWLAWSELPWPLLAGAWPGCHPSLPWLFPASPMPAAMPGAFHTLKPP